MYSLLQSRHCEGEADVGDDRADEATQRQLRGMPLRRKARHDELDDARAEAPDDRPHDGRADLDRSRDAGDPDDELVTGECQEDEAQDQSDDVACHASTPVGSAMPTSLPGAPTLD